MWQFARAFKALVFTELQTALGDLAETTSRSTESRGTYLIPNCGDDVQELLLYRKFASSVLFMIPFK